MQTQSWSRTTREPSAPTPVARRASFDLRACGNVTLRWTAVGDDGRCGTATAYELRGSSAPITRTNFASATPISIAPPAPAGTAESRTFQPPAGAVYFALRPVDKAGNAGPLATIRATKQPCGCV